MNKVRVLLGILVALTLVLAAGCGGTTTTTSAAPTAEVIKPMALKLESFTPAGTPPNKTFYHIFDGLKEATGGAITTEYLEAGVMGSPTETLDRVRQGVVDVGVIVASYYPGVFPMTEIFELPIHYGTSNAAANAILDLRAKGYFDKEQHDFKIITMYSLGPYNMLSAKPVRTVSDLNGMKLRGPGDMYRRISEAVGGVPITMPGAELFNALDKGIIDATWAIWEMSFAFKLQEATDYTIQTNTSTSIHVFVMNQSTWDKLPKVAKDYLDSNFNAFVKFAADTWDATNAHFFDVLMEDARIENIVWSDAETAKFDALLAPIFDQWISEREAQGYPARQAVDDLYKNLKAQGIERPFAQ